MIFSHVLYQLSYLATAEKRSAEQKDASRGSPVWSTVPGRPLHPSDVSSSDSSCSFSGDSSGMKTLMSSFSLPGGSRQST